MPTLKKAKKDEDKTKQALSYFVSKGYTPEVASGIVGNLVHESRLNTGAEGDKGFKGGSSFGLAQWRGDRLTRLKKAYGDNWTDFNNQLEFVDWELNNTHKNAGEMLRRSKNVYDAGRVFSDYYEIPQKKYNENKARQLDVNSVASLIGKINISEKEQKTITPTQNTQYNSTPQSTTDVTNLPETEKIVNFEKEQAKIAQATNQIEQDFLKEYQESFSQQEEVEQEEQLVYQLPQTNYVDMFNQVSQFVDAPIAQQGGQQNYTENELAFLSEIATKDNKGQYNHPGKITEISSPNITMKNLNYDVLGISKQTGEKKLMKPEKNYFFKNTKDVIEIPLK